ncbi:hypothetical protein Tco_1158018 [Tanacetum coccineum]
MPMTPDPPALIQQLFKNHQFMEHIRAYNQMFAMTSFGAKIDHSLYVYDTRDELSNSMHHFGGLDESTLNPEIVEGKDIKVKKSKNRQEMKKTSTRERFEANIESRIKTMVEKSQESQVKV